MGTTWSVRLVAAEDADLAAAAAAVQSALDQVVTEMSGWEPESALSRFNRGGPGWHALPPGLAHVLEAALRIAEDSGGAFDPTCGRVVDLWGFGPAPAAAVPPDPVLVSEAVAASGWQRIAFERAGRRAYQPGGLALDLSGIAKGHGVDRAAAALTAAGFGAFLLEVGGELRGAGIKPDGQPWWVALEQPPAARLPLTRIALCGLSVATSGDYRRFVLADGERRAHSIDPRIGRPVANGVASVSVLHEECMIADAWATTLMVLGLEAGATFATEREIAAHFIERTAGGFRERMTPALEAML